MCPATTPPPLPRSSPPTPRRICSLNHNSSHHIHLYRQPTSPSRAALLHPTCQPQTLITTTTAPHPTPKPQRPPAHPPLHPPKRPAPPPPFPTPFPSTFTTINPGITIPLHPHQIPIPPPPRRPHKRKRIQPGLLRVDLGPEQDLVARHAPQQHVQPAVAGDERAGRAEVGDGHAHAGHGGDAAQGERGRAEDVDYGIEEEGFVVVAAAVGLVGLWVVGVGGEEGWRDGGDFGVGVSGAGAGGCWEVKGRLSVGGWAAGVFAEGYGDEGVEDAGKREGDEDPEVVEEKAKQVVLDVHPTLEMVS